MSSGTYRTPDGEFTSDLQVWLDAWDAMAKPVEKLTGWTLDSFGPGMRFYDKINDCSHDVPVELARRISKLMADADARPHEDVRRTEYVVKLEAVAEAARLFRTADTGGGFNDRVVTGRALDAALAALDGGGQ